MSTEPTTEMMNEVIARFMGYKRVTVGYSGTEEETEWQRNNEQWMDKVGITMVGDYYVDVENDEWMFCDDANYDKSWDALMPVGKKIRDLLTEMQKKRPPHTACHGDLIEVDIHCAVSSYDIVNAHKNMYIFIKWYNEYQQKQTNEVST